MKAPISPLPAPLRRVAATWVEERGRRLLYFAGCDYFGLSWHSRVRAAAARAIRREGLSVGASRRTTGNHPCYAGLEQSLAAFLGAPVMLASSGYLTNLALAASLRGRFTHLLIDARAHTSLQLAAASTGLPVLPFHHRSTDAARQAAKQAGPRSRVALLTDGLFSHDGSVAPLSEYRARLPRNAWLWIDDAHGTGVLGKHGRGSLEQAGLGWDSVLMTGTFSKAFGGFGGWMAAPAEILQQVVETSGPFIGSTPMPIALAAGACEAIELLRNHPDWRQKLLTHAAFVREGLRASGWTSSTGPGPVIPVIPESAGEADRVSRRLRRAGIHPPLIRYSGGSQQPYFRLVVNLHHRRTDLAALLAGFGER